MICATVVTRTYRKLLTRYTTELKTCLAKYVYGRLLVQNIRIRNLRKMDIIRPNNLIDQYTFDATVTIAHGYNKFLKY